MPIKIVFLLLPHSNLLDLGGASQVFFEAKDHGLEVEIQYCSLEDSPIIATYLPIGAIQNYKNVKINKHDYLIILSADYNHFFSNKFKIEPEFLLWLKEIYDTKITICAICIGAFLLGKAGLLDGRKCTTHWKKTDEFEACFPKAIVQKNTIFVEDDGIYTSAGANSAIDVALEILSKIKGEYFTHKVARELVVYNRRSGYEAQNSVYLNYRNHIHLGIHKVQDYLQENLHKKNTIDELAEIANMSLRNFCRIFKKETALTAIEYVNLIRKERIIELKKLPDISRKQIAQKCGLTSERQISRIMK